ncbi:hypothetical protein VPHF86_0142 [Vibrio phage F86]
MIIFNQLNEKTFDIDDEVDYLYDLFFREFIESFDPNDLQVLPSNFGAISGPDFVEDSNNPDIEEAHDRIWLEEITTNVRRGNVYVPSGGEASINFSIPSSAYKAYEAGIVRQLSAKDQKAIKNEMTEARMKGTIMHELSHWMNDAFGNQFLSKRKRKADLSGNANKTLNQGKARGHQFLTDYELDAQIHAIYQYRRSNPRKWETMTLGEALEEMPFHRPLEDSLTRKEYKEWKKYMYTRLARENMLGRRMKKARSLDEAEVK